jgi:hypothetical protein
MINSVEKSVPSVTVNALGMLPMQERIYICRRAHNDTKRLERLFELYTKTTASQKKANSQKSKKA